MKAERCRKTLTHSEVSILFSEFQEYSAVNYEHNEASESLPVLIVVS